MLRSIILITVHARKLIKGDLDKSWAVELHLAFGAASETGRTWKW